MKAVSPLLFVLFCSTHIILSTGCGKSADALTGPPTATPTTPTWSQLTFPGLISTQGAMSATTDGCTYAADRTGTSPTFVIPVYRSCNSGASWTTITGTGLPTTESPRFFYATPNNTIFFVLGAGAGGPADIYYWNGSTSSPTWTKVTGWTGVSSQNIYNMATDAAGYTYFSPAFSGDIWKNTAPNSTTFSKIVTNFYSITNGGSAPHTTSGAIYQLRIWNLGDGRGEMFWLGGEGELDNINTSFTPLSNTAYSPVGGYTGNMTSLDKSPTTILYFLQDATGATTLNSINTSTKLQTTHASPNPRTGNTWPYGLNVNQVDTLHWVKGTTFIASTRNSAGTTFYLLLSTDDGNTWTDMTTISGLGASCSGSNLYVGATTDGSYVYTRCQTGEVWRYGPL